MSRSSSLKDEMLALGLIAGSGLNLWEDFHEFDSVDVETPFGSPSSPLWIGDRHGLRVAVLKRHGEVDQYLPSEVNYRANIHALKQVGVEKIIAVGAVGSLIEDLKPGSFVIPDQFIDLTYRRETTLFGQGLAASAPLLEPISPSLLRILSESLLRSGGEVQTNGVYVCIEGPQTPTRAENDLYRSWNASVVGMTMATEAKLAREAEIEYVNLGLVSDSNVQLRMHHTLKKMNELTLKALDRALRKLKLEGLESRYRGLMKGSSRGKGNSNQFESARNADRPDRKQTSRRVLLRAKRR